MLSIRAVKFALFNGFECCQFKRKTIFFVPLLCVLSLPSKCQPLVYASHGKLDARTWDFSNRLSLNGYWDFYPMQLLTPQECLKARHAKNTYFPSIWNETAPTGIGFATYSLLIIVPASINTFSLELPTVYCSYELWVNNKKAGANGKVGRTEEETTPQWLPQVIKINNVTDTLHVVLQIANFHHHRGGIKDSIYLGIPHEVNPRYSVSLVSNLINIVFAFIIGLVFMILFVRQNEKVILYFSFLCVSWCIRSLFSNPYTFIHFLPNFDWFVATKIEYITLFLVNIFAIMFLSHLFPNFKNQGVRYFLVFTNCLFIFIVIISSPLFFTRWLPAYLIFSASTLVYAIIIILWATLHEQLEAWLMVISLMLGIVTFSYDLISYQGVLPYNPMVLNAGYLLIFILMAIALLLHLGFVKSNKPRPITILTYEDFFKEKD